MKQQGFTIATIAIIIVVVVLGFGLWFVSNNKDQKPPVRAAGTNSPEPTEDSCKAQLSRQCIEIAPAEKTKFSKLPEGLQTVAIAEISKQAPACVKEGKLVDYEGQLADPDVKYAPIGSAIIPIGCDSPSAGLFSKIKADWQFVEKTQFGFTCNAIFNSVVPEKLLSFDKPAECIDDSGQAQSYSSEAKKRFY
jgi:hypothetical protein